MAKFCIFQHFNNIVLYQMIARVWTSKTISMFDTAIINSFKFRINHIFHSYCEQNEIIMNIIKLWLTQDWPTGPSPSVLRWNLLEKSGITRFYEVILRYINFDKNILAIMMDNANWHAIQIFLCFQCSRNSKVLNIILLLTGKKFIILNIEKKGKLFNQTCTICIILLRFLFIYLFHILRFKYSMEGKKWRSSSKRQ